MDLRVLIFPHINVGGKEGGNQGEKEGRGRGK